LPLVSAFLVVTAIGATLAAQAPSTSAGAQLHTLFDREWEWELQQSPLTASSLSDKRWNDRWDDMSLAALDKRQEHRKKVLDEVTAIPRAQLSATDQVNYDVFRYQYRMSVEGYQHRYQLVRTDVYGGVQNTEQVIDTLSFTSVKDYEDWMARLSGFPAYIDQNIELMREGMRTNVLLPKIIVNRVKQQLDRMVDGKPDDSGFYRPFRRFPASISSADQSRLSAAGLERVRATR